MSRRAPDPVLPHDRSAQLEAERQADYGNPAECHERIAKMWTVWLGHPVSGPDVAMMMVLLKIARLRHAYKQDSVDDLKVYLGFWERWEGRE